MWDTSATWTPLSLSLMHSPHAQEFLLLGHLCTFPSAYPSHPAQSGHQRPLNPVYSFLKLCYTGFHEPVMKLQAFYKILLFLFTIFVETSFISVACLSDSRIKSIFNLYNDMVWFEFHLFRIFFLFGILKWLTCQSIFLGKYSQNLKGHHIQTLIFYHK
jgi:hypothetical protein